VFKCIVMVAIQSNSKFVLGVSLSLVGSYLSEMRKNNASQMKETKELDTNHAFVKPASSPV
jgi:hypothetical protein